MTDPLQQSSSQTQLTPQYPPYQSLDSYQRDSVFRPTSSRAFNTVSDQIHQPVDIVSSKLDKLLQHNKTTDTNFKNLRQEIGSLRAQVELVNTLKDENTKIKQHLSVALGKINRLEKQKEDHHQKLITIEQHSFAKDVVMYNLEESNPESIIDLRSKIYDTFLNTMHIPLANIFHPRNPGAEIRIDNCFRIGKKVANKPRPVIISFLTLFGKQLAMDRKFTKNLSSTKLRIANRFQSEVRERREVQVQTLRSLRDSRKETGDRIHLVNDKILINNQEHEDLNFKRNPIPSLTSLSIDYAHIQHGSESSKKHSHFQGHCAHVRDISQATAAMNSLLQSPDLSKSEHLIYAYRIKDESDVIHSGYSDDHEIKASKILHGLLEEMDKTQHFLCVTRIKNGPNIGPDRFDLIKKAANDVLSLPIKPEEPDQFYLRLS